MEASGAGKQEVLVGRYERDRWNDGFDDCTNFVGALPRPPDDCTNGIGEEEAPKSAQILVNEFIVVLEKLVMMDAGIEWEQVVKMALA